LRNTAYACGAAGPGDPLLGGNVSAFKSMR